MVVRDDNEVAKYVNHYLEMHAAQSSHELTHLARRSRLVWQLGRADISPHRSRRTWWVVLRQNEAILVPCTLTDQSRVIA
jgi:hypothetical protein